MLRRTCICVVLWLSAASGAHATELRIGARAQNDAPVLVEKVELLLVAWGDTERIPLPFTIEGERALFHLPLDPEWLSARWSRASDMEAAFIYLTGRNFVSLRSLPFSWLGRATGPTSQPSSEVTIDFGQGQRIMVASGETKDIIVNVRTVPEARPIRLVYEDGTPATNATVSAYMFWSNSNHCGVLNGADPLVRGVRANRDGLVTLPDGDFEYALDVGIGPHESVVDSETDPNGVIETYLDTAERVVRIHRNKRQPLSLRVMVGDQVVRDAPFTETVRGSGCGVRTGGLFSWTDDGRMVGPTLEQDGTVVISDFYPEEVEAICLGDERGETIWTLSTFGSEPVTARFPAGTRLAMTTYCSGQ